METEFTLEQGGDTRSFYLREKGMGRINSTLLVETPEGLIICGDLCPRQNGVISNYGYGFEWFSKQLGREYLCSKFLRRTWIPDLAVEWLNKQLSDEDISDRIKEEIQEYLEDVDGFGPGEEFFYDWFTSTFQDSPDDIGYGYDPHEADLLVEIQKRFAALYGATQEVALS